MAVTASTPDLPKSASATAESSEREIAPAPRPLAPRWARVAGYWGGAFLGGVLLFAAYAKALVPQAFAADIRAQGLAFGMPPALLAIAAVALEAALGVALLVNLRRRSVMVVATLLVAFFLVLTGRTFWRALHGTLPAEGAGCGCFGNLVERTPGEAFAEDLALLVPSLALAWLGRPAASRAARWRIGVVALVAVGAALFTWRSPALPLDDLATDLKPGVLLTDLCAGRAPQRVCLGTIAPKLLAGRHLVVIADVHAKDFAPIVTALNAFVKRAPGTPVSVLADFSPDEQMTLFFQYAPAFELIETPGALLARLERALPRSFLVEGAQVTRTWSGLPPFDELAPGGAPNPGERTPR